MIGTIIDLTLGQMVLLVGMIIPPLIVIQWLGLGLTKRFLVALTKMCVQLTLIGFYLKYLFDLNSLWVNLAWLLVMLLTANHAILKQAGLNFKRLWLMTFSGVLAASGVITLYFLLVVIQPDPWYDTRYLIPLFGMILGNCMRGNVMALERFYGDLRDQRAVYETRLLLGATRFEALRPFMQTAMRAAAAPAVATIGTTGIVSLPGMMTGQILGGVDPMVAVKYQMAIMMAIFSVMICGAVLTILFSMRVAFDPFDQLNSDLFD